MIAKTTRNLSFCLRKPMFLHCKRAYFIKQNNKYCNMLIIRYLYNYNI
ncbi:hypothetical protein HMPREF9419_2255 [Prevotella nigrescens ATCC 33563]|nr:hypothetical protein HMPREF9419_2255 [Prevotella nigrescens ATCC 33563]